MLFKIVTFPDSEIMGDLGTCYIVTEHRGFIEALESITDYHVMDRFLTENKRFYIEIFSSPAHYDKEINVSPFKEWTDDLNLCEFISNSEENIIVPHINELRVK